MIKKLFEKLFDKKNLPIDRLLEFTSPGMFYFWNGVNYSDEIMLTKDPNYPQHGSDYYTAKDPPPFVKIGFGNVVSGYGDWGGGFDRTSEPLVEMFINKKDLTIRSIRISDGFYNGERPSKETLKKLNKILKHVKVGDTFQTSNKEITDILSLFIQTKSDFQHCFCMTHHGAEPGSFNRFKSSLEWSIHHYMERHPKWEVTISDDWLKEHPEAKLEKSKTFDEYDPAYAYWKELMGEKWEIPSLCVSLDPKKHW